jgi:hypothetical protein
MDLLDKISSAKAYVFQNLDTKLTIPIDYELRFLLVFKVIKMIEPNFDPQVTLEAEYVDGSIKQLRANLYVYPTEHNSYDAYIEVLIADAIPHNISNIKKITSSTLNKKWKVTFSPTKESSDAPVYKIGLKDDV